MARMPTALAGHRCGRCKGFMLTRPDKIPLCSECEKKMVAEIKARVPKVRGKVLVSERVG